MSSKLTVGVLLSNSTILPMARKFNDGLKQGLAELTLDSDWEVNVIPEFIGQGSKEDAEAAINKLFNFDNSDFITGILSNKVGYELSDKIAKYKIPFIINNIGEHLPDPSLYNNDYVFLNSVHTWQQLWAMGNQAVKLFGKKGMYVSGIYDCGYSFQVMLNSGMAAAAADSVMPFAIAPAKSYKGLADVASVIPHIIQNNPDFVMATFCGEEATLFLDEYIRHGLHKKIPLLGLPFLLEPFTQSAEPLSVYTTISSCSNVESADIDGLSKMASDPFAQFGYESGLLITDAVKKSIGKSLQQALALSAINSERGKVEVLPQTTGKGSRVFLVKNTYYGDKAAISRELVAELETISIDNEVITNINSQLSSGWVNPYLGI